MRRYPLEKATEDQIGGIVLRIGRKELARKTGIDYSTLCRRLKNIRTLQLWELWAILEADK